MLTVENLEKLGFKNLRVRQDNEIQCSCPLGTHEDKNPSFSLNLFSGKWICFSCGRKGRNIESLAKILHKPELNKYFEYTSYSDLAKSVLNRLDTHKDLSDKLIDLEYLVDYYKSYYTHEYLYTRGVSYNVADKFNIGYDKENSALTFPVYTIDKKFLGFTYRYLEGNYRYKHEINKSITLYGAQFLQHGDIIVVEGNIDVLKAYSLGFENVVALTGTKMSDTQFDILKKYGKNIVIALDNDFNKVTNWGQIAAQRIFKKLLPIFGNRLYIGEYENKKDFGEINTKEEFKITAYLNWRLKNIA